MATVPTNHRLAERVLVAAVRDGYWRIDDQGRIWRRDGRRADREVALIREAYSRGEKTQQQLADDYGVRFQAISRIIRGDRRSREFGPISRNNRAKLSARDKRGRIISGAAGEFPEAPVPEPAHSLEAAIADAERALEDAESEFEFYDSERRTAAHRLEELRRSIVRRRRLTQGQFFEIEGEVFRLTDTPARDFGGAVGLCIRAHRQGLDGRRIASVCEAEWIQAQGERRLFESKDEAEVYVVLGQVEEDDHA